jgi:hypothetical protein
MIVKEIVKQVGHLATQAMAGFDLSVEIRDESSADVVELIKGVVQMSAQQGFRLRGVRIGPFERQIARLENAQGFTRVTTNALSFGGILIIDSDNHDGAVQFSFGKKP